MSEVIEDAAVATARPALPVSEFTVSLAVCLVTVAGVGIALIDAPLDPHGIALPVFVFGAAIMFGLGLTEISRGGELRFGPRRCSSPAFSGRCRRWPRHRIPSPNSVGHVSQWLADLAAAYLLLSYPSGRLREGTDRRLFVAAALLVGLLFLPTALVGQFPHPSPWSTCNSICPANVFSLRRLDAERRVAPGAPVARGAAGGRCSPRSPSR